MASNPTPYQLMNYETTTETRLAFQARRAQLFICWLRSYEIRDPESMAYWAGRIENCISAQIAMGFYN